ncbi:MAG: hypothetical protein IPK07_03205 [Deltaproteobacteria bacterium]|nr:hypothetical protein [Deltaproteobacteria bacterium]
MSGAPRSPAPQVGPGDATGTTTSEPSSRVDFDPVWPLGKLVVEKGRWSRRAEARPGGRSPGDPDAQAKAFGEMMGSVLSGGDPVEVLSVPE